MQGTNVLFGQIAAVFGIVIAGVWTATQWTASALGYQGTPGLALVRLLRHAGLSPWRLFDWWFFFGAYAPQVFDIGGAIAAASGMVAVAVAIAMSIRRSRQSRLVTTYGSARWAEAADIHKAGLDQTAGFSLACMATSTCATKGLSMFWPSHRHAPARASAWLSPRC